MYVAGESVTIGRAGCECLLSRGVVLQCVVVVCCCGTCGVYVPGQGVCVGGLLLQCEVAVLGCAVVLQCVVAVRRCGVF